MASRATSAAAFVVVKAAVRARSAEVLNVVLELWASEGPFSHHGQFFDIETPSFERGPAFDAIGAEHRAVRERVALIDMSSFSKFEVRGPGALTVNLTTGQAQAAASSGSRS